MGPDRFSLPGILVSLVTGLIVIFSFVTYPLSLLYGLFHVLLALMFAVIVAYTHLPTRDRIKEHVPLFGAAFTAIMGAVGLLKVDGLLLPGLLFALTAFFVACYFLVDPELIPS